MNKIKNYKFTPDWLAGFTQADGSFVISFGKQSEGKMAVRPRPIFNLTQSIRELDLFKELQKYLSIGNVQINKNNVTLVVSNIEEIIQVLIPLLNKTPLRGSKYQSFQIFKLISKMMYDKKHLTVEGVLEILELSYFMNKDTTLRTNESKEALLNCLKFKHGTLPIININHLKPLILPLNETSQFLPLTLEFIRGLIDGDGSFNVTFYNFKRRINVNFTIVHELSSISLLNELKTFFNCGKIYKLPSAAARYQVVNVDDILNNIYPIFKNIEFNTAKDERFKIAMEVAKIIKTEGYKTNINLKKIVDLAWNMTQEGKYRKITKLEYLVKFCTSN